MQVRRSGPSSRHKKTSCINAPSPLDVDVRSKLPLLYYFFTTNSWAAFAEIFHPSISLPWPCHTSFLRSLPAPTTNPLRREACFSSALALHRFLAAVTPQGSPSLSPTARRAASFRRRLGRSSVIRHPQLYLPNHPELLGPTPSQLPPHVLVLLAFLDRQSALLEANTNH